ncbi:hypothetical protein AAZX31_14G124500 [Glycine max]|nr:hypothetical protein GLYMA_14G137850v4 [Glycine max]KAH1094398.1 hypothetical protein GYH30_039899 [Glycine max]|eukprot:XP_006596165.2 uncharacterized protein LOC102669376 [Glycine max]
MDLLSRLSDDFLKQIKEVIRKASENLQHGENTTMLPIVPNKRGRKTSTKLVFEVGFSFEPPKFCKDENIDLDKELLNLYEEGASRGNHVPRFSMKGRLENWLLEKRERCTSTTTSTKEERKTQYTYYHHLSSNLKFRSQPELIHFLLHGGLPHKQHRKQAKHGNKKRNRGCKKRKLAE